MEVGPPMAGALKAIAPAISSANAACVPAAQAGPLVMSCAGQPFKVETTLGNAYPDPDKREHFCRCVAERSLPREPISCGGSLTFLDVIVRRR
jgi:hypothetical protein